MQDKITNRKMTTTIEHNYWRITAEVEFEITGKSGIGSYEFWGSKGFDEGQDEWEVSSLEITEILDQNGDEVQIESIDKETISVWYELLHEQADQEFVPDEH